MQPNRHCIDDLYIPTNNFGDAKICFLLTERNVFPVKFVVSQVHTIYNASVKVLCRLQGSEYRVQGPEQGVQGPEYIVHQGFILFWLFCFRCLCQVSC